MNCPQCSHPTRPMHMKAHEAPGTRQRCGDGLCKNCYYQRRKNDPILTPEQLRAARNALDGWLQARNNRLGKGAPCVKQTKPSKKLPTNSTKCGAKV